MTGKGAMEYLKGVCDSIDLRAKTSLRRTVAVATIPVAAAFSVACYAAPPPDNEFEDTIEACSDGWDNDEDSYIDCADTSCSGIGDCGPEVCDDEFDNDGDENVDCEDDDCAADAACQ